MGRKLVSIKNKMNDQSNLLLQLSKFGFKFFCFRDQLFGLSFMLQYLTRFRMMLCFNKYKVQYNFTDNLKSQKKKYVVDINSIIKYFTVIFSFSFVALIFISIFGGEMSIPIYNIISLNFMILAFESIFFGIILQYVWKYGYNIIKNLLVSQKSIPLYLLLLILTTIFGLTLSPNNIQSVMSNIYIFVTAINLVLIIPISIIILKLNDFPKYIESIIKKDVNGGTLSEMLLYIYNTSIRNEDWSLTKHIVGYISECILEDMNNAKKVNVDRMGEYINIFTKLLENNYVDESIYIRIINAISDVRIIMNIKYPEKIYYFYTQLIKLYYNDFNLLKKANTLVTEDLIESIIELSESDSNEALHYIVTLHLECIKTKLKRVDEMNLTKINESVDMLINEIEFKKFEQSNRFWELFDNIIEIITKKYSNCIYAILRRKFDEFYQNGSNYTISNRILNLIGVSMFNSDNEGCKYTTTHDLINSFIHKLNYISLARDSKAETREIFTTVRYLGYMIRSFNSPDMKTQLVNRVNNAIKGSSIINHSNRSELNNIEREFVDIGYKF